MPIFNEDNLKKEISVGKIANSYLIFGEDTFLKKHYVDLLCKKSFSGDPFFNFHKFENSVDLQDVYDAANQLPMMADSKCILLLDYDFEHASKTDFDRLCELLTENSDFSKIILKFDSVEFDYKKSARAKKLAASVEKGNGRVAELNHRSQQALSKILTDAASKRGCVLKSNVALYLIQTVGEDLNILRSEIDKLCAFTGHGEIQRETVDLVCIKTIEGSVYNYVNEVMNGNVSKALNILDDVFYMRMEPIAILYTVSASFIDMLRVYSAQKARVPITSIATDFGYKNRAFVLDKAANHLRRSDSNRLSACLDALLLADTKLKTSKADAKIILEELTVKLIYIIVKGEAVD